MKQSISGLSQPCLHKTGPISNLHCNMYTNYMRLDASKQLFKKFFHGPGLKWILHEHGFLKCQGNEVHVLSYSKACMERKK